MSRPTKTLGSDFPIFDGNEALNWVVLMTSSVADARVKNIAPGARYTFVFIQNAVGGHTFQWPSNCLNPPPINIDPNGKTAALFIGTSEGNIAGNSPAIWT